MSVLREQGRASAVSEAAVIWQWCIRGLGGCVAMAEKYTECNMPITPQLLDDLNVYIQRLQEVRKKLT